MAKKAPAPKSITKTEFLRQVAEHSGLDKKDVQAVLDAVGDVVEQELGPKGPGVLTLPGMMKMKLVIKPAQPERDGIDPFTKQPKRFKAKPESRRVKVTPLKALKDRVDK